MFRVLLAILLYFPKLRSCDIVGVDILEGQSPVPTEQKAGCPSAGVDTLEGQSPVRTELEVR